MPNLLNYFATSICKGILQVVISTGEFNFFAQVSISKLTQQVHNSYLYMLKEKTNISKKIDTFKGKTRLFFVSPLQHVLEISSDQDTRETGEELVILCFISHPWWSRQVYLISLHQSKIDTFKGKTRLFFVSPLQHVLEISSDQDTRETGEELVILCFISHPWWSRQVYLISLHQIQDGAQGGRAITSVSSCCDEGTILPEVCSNHGIYIVDMRIELVGSVLRGDEFTVIGAVVVVNVATSYIYYRLVEFDNLPRWKRCVIRQFDGEVNT